MVAYTEQWKTMRRLEWCFYSWFFTWLVIALLELPQMSNFQNLAARDTAMYLCLGTFAGGAFLLRLWLGTVKCPRCGSSFYGGARVPCKACTHCGLRRNAEQ